MRTVPAQGAVFSVLSFMHPPAYSPKLAFIITQNIFLSPCLSLNSHFCNTLSQRSLRARARVLVCVLVYVLVFVFVLVLGLRGR